METRIIPVSDRALKEAVKSLKAGLPVVYPTETFYGLGVDAYDHDAVLRVRAVKGKREDKPFPLIVKDMDMARDIVGEFPPWAGALAGEFWPGPLTLVLKSRKNFSPLVCGRSGAVGIRIPGHHWAVRLVEAFGSPLTATSANPGGDPAPTDPKVVVSGLGGMVSLILDAGKLRGTKGSTVLDVTVFPPVVLRDGEIPAATLEKVWKRYSPMGN